MIPSLTRTVVPLIVGYVVAGLTAIGVQVPDDVREWITGAVGLVIASAYYGLVRLLERRWPALSVLLGSRQQPAAYTPGAPDVPPAAVTPADPDQPAAGVPPDAGTEPTA